VPAGQHEAQYTALLRGTLKGMSSRRLGAWKPLAVMFHTVYHPYLPVSEHNVGQCEQQQRMRHKLRFG
jgi:hypothetical protein